MSKVLAQAKIYRRVELAELEKIAGSIHHGGIVAVVAPEPLKSPTMADLQAWARKGERRLCSIGNAQQPWCGARTAAFFSAGDLHSRRCGCGAAE